MASFDEIRKAVCDLERDALDPTIRFPITALYVSPSTYQQVRREIGTEYVLLPSLTSVRLVTDKNLPTDVVILHGRREDDIVVMNLTTGAVHKVALRPMKIERDENGAIRVREANGGEVQQDPPSPGQ